MKTVSNECSNEWLAYGSNGSLQLEGRYGFLIQYSSILPCICCRSALYKNLNVGINWSKLNVELTETETLIK